MSYNSSDRHLSRKNFKFLWCIVFEILNKIIKWNIWLKKYLRVIPFNIVVIRLYGYGKVHPIYSYLLLAYILYVSYKLKDSDCSGWYYLVSTRCTAGTHWDRVISSEPSSDLRSKITQGSVYGKLQEKLLEVLFTHDFLGK